MHHFTNLVAAQYSPRRSDSSDDFLIHIHKYHDLSNGVVIFCVMGKKEERKKQSGDDSYKALEPDIRRYYEATK